MRWNPSKGHVPRGYLGGEGHIEEIELVLIIAEPGDPLPGEQFHFDQSVQELFREVYQFVRCRYSEKATSFHTKARSIINLCWPDLSFDEQLKKVWITESVLCSAKVESGPVAAKIGRACIRLLPNATFAAFGRKAQKRTAHLNVEIQPAYAIAPPGCNFNGAQESYQKIAEIVRSKSQDSKHS